MIQDAAPNRAAPWPPASRAEEESMRVITIPGKSADWSIGVIERGPFGVHPALSEKGWALTHCATGRALAVGLCCQESAFDLADALIACGAGWDAIPAGGFAGHAPKPYRAAQKIILEHKCKKHSA